MKIIVLLFISIGIWGQAKPNVVQLFQDTDKVSNHIYLEGVGEYLNDKIKDDVENYPVDDWYPVLEEDTIISFNELSNVFEEIGQKYNIPHQLLKVVAANETGWVVNYNYRGRYGIMGLEKDEAGNDYKNYKKNIDSFAKMIFEIKKKFEKEKKEINSIEDYYAVLIKYYQKKYGEKLTFFIQQDIDQFYKDINEGYTLTDAEKNKIYIKPFSIDFKRTTSLYTKLDYPNRSWVSQSVHSDHYRTSNRTAADISNIVVHITAGSTLSGAVSWWHKSKAQRGNVGSAHYIVARDGRVYQAVHDKDLAWHAKGFNMKAIGIEHVGTVRQGYTETIYKASADLSRWLCEEYNISKRHTSRYGGSGILGHNETGSPKACPGPFDYDHYISLINNGNGGGNQCTNDCTADTYRCKNNNVEVCSDSDNDGCVEWNSFATCSVNTTCHSGTHSCEPDGNGCQNECNYSGQKRCGGDGTHTQTCVRNSQGCYVYVMGRRCSDNQTCNGGVCKTGQQKTCPHGNGTYCRGDDLTYCTNGSYRVIESCDYGCKSMPDGTPDKCNGEGQCQNECSEEAELSCNGNKIVTCINVNGCLRKKTKQVCGSGFSCSDGSCIRKGDGTGNNCEASSLTARDNSVSILLFIFFISIFFLRRKKNFSK